MERIEQVLAELIGVDTKGQWSARALFWAGMVASRLRR